jgi:hypothetical protein
MHKRDAYLIVRTLAYRIVLTIDRYVGAASGGSHFILCDLPIDDMICRGDSPNFNTTFTSCSVF